MPILSAYRLLLDDPRVRRGQFLVSLLVRTAAAAAALLIFLAAQHSSQSFAVAGLATGAFSLGAAVCAPIRGRAVDARPRAALIALGAVQGAALAALAATPDEPILMVGLAGVAGSSAPPLAAIMRQRWRQWLSDDQAPLQRAYALEAVGQEATAALGPLCAGLAAATLGASSALALGGALILVGTVWVADPNGGRRADDRENSIHVLRLPGFTLLMAALAATDASLGATQVTASAFGLEAGGEELAGALVAAVTVGSIVGGLTLGARFGGVYPLRAFIVTNALIAATTLPLAVAHSAVVMAPLLVLAGLPLAVQWAVVLQLLDRLAPERAGVEAFTWLTTSSAAGIALGAAAAGPVVDSAGTTPAFLAAVAAACVGTGLAVLLRIGVPARSST
jgi:predicted MFS family arabinose efflux permease